MSLPSDFVFSQASLQDYADCPRRFQLRYVLGVQWPRDVDESSLEWERRARQGALFHHLIHQHTVGIPECELQSTIHHPDLRRWWEAYLNAPPANLPAAVRRSEVRLSTGLADTRLVARYDLLAAEPGKRAVIVDWKTSPRRPSRLWLENRWQTRVYRYVLVEAGAQFNAGRPVTPGQVELIYWFAEFPQQVERFSYDADQHKAAGQALRQLADQIAAHKSPEWPLTEDLTRCRYCTYRTLCDRTKVAAEGEGLAEELEVDPFDFDLDLEQIAEVEF
jgi:CRISPR/Cas system-associated exonuclease Cas4 (RecB family)